VAGPRVPDYVESLEAYPPGKPIEELKRELGLKEVIKLASNENPFGPSPLAIKAIEAILPQLHRYPDGSGYYLKQKLAARLSQPAERIVLGCGSNEILDLICRVFVGRGGRAVLPHPSFLVYQKFLQAVGAEARLVPLRGAFLDLAGLRAAVGAETRLLVLCNPNNPTGSAFPASELADFIGQLPDSVIVLADEAYIEFARQPGVVSLADLVSEERNLVVTRTFSKLYGLAGLRVGYGIMPARLANYLNRVRQPFNVTSPALAAAEAALEDQAYLAEVLRRTWAGLDHLAKGLESLGLEVWPSQANFLLFKVPRPAEEIYRLMLAKGVIIRAMTAFGLPDCLRVNAGTEEENRVFLTRLAEVLGRAES